MALGTSAEAAGAIVGGVLGGMIGLCIGWAIAATCEALGLLPAVMSVSGALRTPTPAEVGRLGDRVRDSTEERSEGQVDDGVVQPMSIGVEPIQR